MKRIAILLLVSLTAVAVAQPDPTTPPSDQDPWGPSTGSGSAGSGSATGSGSAAGSNGPATGSNGPATGSGSGTGSATGSGSSAGSGSGTGPRIIQVPTDLDAPTVNAAASPTEVRLGGKFTVFVTATFNAGVEVNLREPLDLGPAFEVTRRLSEDKPTGDGRTVREWQLEVIAWELGDLKIPPIAVTYTTMGKADQVATNAINLRVTGVLGDVVDDPKAMRGDAPPTDLLSRDWFLLYVAIGVAVGLGLLFTLIAVVRSRRRRVQLVGGVFAVPRKFDSASDRALHKLEEIEDSGVLDRDDDRKTGYAEMVEVIREYIGSRYRVATFDLTTIELLKKLAKLASAGEQTMIETWLERCDIVKYGGLKATVADAKKTLEDARALVVTTSQMPVVPKPPVVADAPAEPAKPVVAAKPVDPTKSPWEPPNPPQEAPEAPEAPPPTGSDDDEATRPFTKEESA